MNIKTVKLTDETILKIEGQRDFYVNCKGQVFFSEQTAIDSMLEGVNKRPYYKEGSTESKSFLVYGNTQQYRETLSILGGKWNKKLSGWVFANKNEHAVTTWMKGLGQL